MANIQSQIKRNRQNLVARERNKAVRSRTRNTVKRLEDLIAEGDQEGAQAQLTAASRALDRAATKGVMHRNAAARKKSRLARRIDAMAG